MDKQAIESYYNDALKKEQTPAIATLTTLIEFLRRDLSETAFGLRENVRRAIETLKELDPITEVESVAEIFFRFITLTASNYDKFHELKSELTKRGEIYLNRVMNCVTKIAKNAHPFLSDGSTVLVHGYSKAVLKTLFEASSSNKRITVYVTQSCPDLSGKEMCMKLKSKGIQSTLILDAAVGYIMEKVDIVMVGAEGVAESGGIINKIGTYPVSICAKAMNKPFYVLAESYKFIRLFPLSQSDIPSRLKRNNKIGEDKHPLVDYTPPSYITLLLTDLGTLTTAAVSDQLMQLYL